MFFLGYPFGIPMYSAVHLQKTESWQHNTAISATKDTKKKKKNCRTGMEIASALVE